MRRFVYYCRTCDMHLIRRYSSPPSRIVCPDCATYAVWKIIKPPSWLRKAKERLLKNLEVLRKLGIGKYRRKHDFMD